MADTTAARSVDDALSDVARWREEESGKQRSQLMLLDQKAAEVDSRVAALTAQLEELRKEREALGHQRAELEAGAVSPVEEHRRAYDALFSVLQAQSQAIGARGVAYAEATRARDAKVAAALEEPGLKKMAADYEAGRQMLAAVPEAYRSAMQEAHTRLEAELRARMAAIQPPPLELAGDPLRIDVVVAVDAIEGTAGVVMAVLPVAETAYTEWAERTDDVQTFVAARTMQAIYQVCKQLGLESAQAMYGGHQGLLAVELELGTGDPDEVLQALRDAVDQVLGDAPELTEARVVAYAQPVDVDYLFPPDDEEADDA